MDWFYIDSGERRGPVSETELSELTRSGKVGEQTLVWREGWSDWRKLADANAVAPTDGTAPCVECGKVFPTSEMIQYEGSWVCATCKPIFFQKVKEGVPITRAMAYAGFWIRFVATIVDGIIMQLVGFAQGLMMGLWMPPDPEAQMTALFVNVGISIAIGAAYEIFFIGKFGATPGKMALRLRVVTASGGSVSYARACGRYFSKFLSSMILLIGYIMAAFDDEKRALHDRICDTRVIRLNA